MVVGIAVAAVAFVDAVKAAEPYRTEAPTTEVTAVTP
jgi:hypothetical protein